MSSTSKPRQSVKQRPETNEVRVFVSYSHKDTYWMDALMPLLVFNGTDVKPWSDKEIRPGVRWDAEIKKELAAMDVFIALVSINFAVSRYITEVESNVAMQRLRKGEIEVVPVLIYDPGDAEELEWLKDMQWVPMGAKSWAEVQKEFEHHDFALPKIRAGIKEVIERARARKANGKARDRGHRRNHH